MDSQDVPPATDPVGPVLPAAATITASLSTAAYRIAAPSAAWSTVRSAGRQVIAEMLITRAPRSAACTIARPSVAISRDARASIGSPPDVRGENLAEVTLMDSTRAAGATPEKPSSPGLAGDDPGYQGAMPVAVGQAVGRLHEVAARDRRWAAAGPAAPRCR